ncbi:MULTISPECIES: CBS domain-containing protein [Streptomyces]|uniref:CBS domain-containing protein n=1 Tax=Streptomyces TaxID=1883 RepID=UPI0004CD94C0|nr:MULTISPECIES: CBS domain-containing protein [Streptomyces]KOT51386.1 hypothetical protein ADK43_32285 [Streptomyces rimosus subsp. rimosus]
MRIRDAMREPAVTVPETASVQDTALRMKHSGTRVVFIVNNDTCLLGTVTDRDLAVRVLAAGLPAQVRVKTVMTRRPAAVDADDDLMAAYRTMHAGRAQWIPVVSEGRLVGVVTFDDLFRISTRGLAEPQRAVVEGPDPLAPFRAA